MAKVLYMETVLRKQSVGLSSRQTLVEVETVYAVSPPADAGSNLQQITIAASGSVTIPINLVPVVRALVIKVKTYGLYVTLTLAAGGTPLYIDGLYIQTIPAGHNPSLITIANPDLLYPVDIEVFVTGANS